jgi:hypothetical protein
MSRPRTSTSAAGPATGLAGTLLHALPALLAGAGLLALLTYWGGQVAAGPELYLGVGVLIGLFLAFGVLLYWLYMSPLPAGETVAPAGRSAEARQLVALLVALSGLLSMISAVWDQAWHQLYGGFGDDFLWPPHLMLYASLGMIAVFAAVGLIAIARGRGSLRARFRSEPAIGLLGLVSAFMMTSIPSDAIWHELYGVDITGWSLPHVLLGFGFTLVMAAAFSLQLSLLAPRAWGQPGGRWQARELLAVLPFALVVLGLLLVGVVDWERGGAINAGTTDAYRDAFWSRPEWLFTVVVAAIALFAGNAVLHALRRPGAATIMGLLVAGFRLLTLTFFAATEPAVRLSPTAHLLVVAPLVALDLWYWWRGARGGEPATLHLGSLLAGAAYLAAGLPLIAATMTYPRVNAETVPGMVAFSLLIALAAGWAGARFGEWLSVTAGRSAEPAPVRRWVGRAATAALVTALAVTFIYMLTAPPPL